MTCKRPSWNGKSYRKKGFPEYPIFKDERTRHIQRMKWMPAKTLFLLVEGKAERDGLEFSEMLDSTEEGRENMLTPALWRRTRSEDERRLCSQIPVIGLRHMVGTQKSLWDFIKALWGVKVTVIELTYGWVGMLTVNKNHDIKVVSMLKAVRK